MSGELLLEIGTEEIPARFILPALEGMRALLQSELQSQRISWERIITYGTPRRLVICAQDMAEKQIDTVVTAVGPPLKVAFDPEGKPTKAAENFAFRQGVTVNDLKVIETPKGKYVQVVKTISGKETISLLPEILRKVITNIPFPKSMRWADLDFRFARPIKWILALYNKVIVPITIDNLKTSNQSWGHRFLSNQPFEVSDFKSYLKIVEEHFVIPDPEKRKDLIQNAAQKLAAEVGGKVIEDNELLTEVANLVEYPVTLRGSFSPIFLNLPREVIISSLREHQKYFAIIDSQGNLLPYFIVVANNRPQDPRVVIRGNERVLSARLADAQFFFREDRKKTLFDRLEDLKLVVYQVKLGSMYDKVLRLKELATYLASEIAPAVVEKVKRAALLCKSDLLTEMVGEFPNLQGVMGREYALLEGEEPEIATAIYEHYLPTASKGVLPSSVSGAVLSIAEKIDNIVGCFSIGLIPTGTADPYALRRQALGIINITLEKSFHINLPQIIRRSFELFENKAVRSLDQVLNEVLEFIRGRFINQVVTNQGFDYDVVEAVTSVGFVDLVMIFNRIKTLQELKLQSDFEPLVLTFKRVANIVADKPGGVANPSGFSHEAEVNLYHTYLRIKEDFAEAIARQDYFAALTQLLQLKPAVDAFFDQVLVMCEDTNVRQNRLALLSNIANLFREIADFTKIVTGK